MIALQFYEIFQCLKERHKKMSPHWGVFFQCIFYDLKKSSQRCAIKFWP
jgi:hypothetical protein